MELYNEHRELAKTFNRLLEVSTCDCVGLYSCDRCTGSFCETAVPDDLSTDHLTSPLEELNQLRTVTTSADLAGWRLDRLRTVADTYGVFWKKLRKPELVARLQHELFDEASSTNAKLRARHQVVCEQRVNVTAGRVTFLRSLIAKAQEDLRAAEEHAEALRR